MTKYMNFDLSDRLIKEGRLSFGLGMVSIYMNINPPFKRCQTQAKACSYKNFINDLA